MIQVIVTKNTSYSREKKIDFSYEFFSILRLTILRNDYRKIMFWILKNVQHCNGRFGNLTFEIRAC